MFTETALLQEILASPHDEDVWLVFADWLDDRGDPRAELVRLRHELTRSIEVEGRTAKEARMQELLAAGVAPITPAMTNSVGMKLNLIPPGRFMMGSPASEKERWLHDDRVAVTLTQGFYLGETEVTQSQWAAVMGTRPWRRKKDVQEEPENAATCIRWDDAAEFCSRLTQQEQAAGRSGKDWRYDLPTEAQWEYACRAGTTTRYSFGEDPASLVIYARFQESDDPRDAKFAPTVRRKEPNAWGLYDMHGNVWEWTRDGFANTLPGGVDPFVREGSFKLFRGGCWISTARFCRSAHRDGYYPTYRYNALGFRLAAVRVERTG